MYANHEDYILGVHPEDRERVMAATLRQLMGEATTMEGRVLRPDGEIRWVRDSAYPVLDHDGSVRRLVGTVQDITERKLAEQERALLEARLQEAQKLEAVGRLAGGIAHDFNNMLTVILGNAAVAIDCIEPEHPIRESLESIVKAGERSAELTRQLLAYARRQTIEPKVLDIDRVVAGAVTLLGHMAGEKVSLLWKPSWGLKQVKMDPSQIDQMLACLTLNARDAITGTGHIVIETGMVEVQDGDPERSGGSYLFLRVTDDGCGMDEATASKVFEPFFTTKPQGQGTGLGLAMVYGIMNQNGGFVEVRSAPGLGSTFTLCFPQLRSAAPAVEPTAHRGLDGLGGHETILLALTGTELLDLATRVLERRGYAVLAADNATTALHLAASSVEPVALLVCDSQVLDAGEVDVIHALRQQHGEVRCLLLTEDAPGASVPKGVVLLRKAFAPGVLAECVRATLDAPLEARE